MSQPLYYAYWSDHNVNPKPHLHDQVEVYLSLEDKGDFFLQESRYPLKRGSLFLIHPFEIHHGFVDGHESSARYAIRFPLSLLQFLSTPESDLTALFEAAPKHLLLTQSELVKVCNYMDRLVNPPSGKQPFGADIALNLLLGQCILTLAQIVKKRGPAKQAAPTKYDDLIKNMLQYIYDHYKEDITLDEFSNHMFVSKSRLCKIFKDQTGFTIGNYITMYRLQKACHLLQEGEKVKAVGKAVGFKTYTHFIRTFTSKLGVSPKKFVKEQPFTETEDIEQP